MSVLTDRRKFLIGASAAVAGSAVFGNCFGSDAPRHSATPIGLQLYTVRNLMSASVAETLHLVASIGYQDVEFAGYFGLPPKRIKSLLKRTGLRAPSAHVQLRDFEYHFDQTLEMAVELGHRYLVLAWLPPEDRTITRYREIADLLNRNGVKAQKAGVQVLYHNHEFEFIEHEGVLPYDILTTDTDPNLVKLELDLYWLAVAKQDPVNLIARLPGRIPSIHVKDMDRSGGIADVGAGTLDFRRVNALREQAGIRHYFIEHDNPEDAEITIRNSFRAFSKIIDT